MTKVASQRAVIGVDVGGTKVAAAVVDQAGQLSGRVQRPTALGSAERTLDCIAAAAQEALASSSYSSEQIEAVGVGIPGAVDVERGVGILAVNLGWRNVPVRLELEQRLGLPCVIENDVRAAALGELRFGAGQRTRNLAYLSVGTGIAAGIIIDGRLYRGASGLAGEIGHFSIDPRGPRCSCGAHGCLEAFAAGPALARLVDQELRRGRESALAEQLRRDRALAATTIVTAALEGDEVAVAVLEQAAETLARGVALLLVSYDPELIVLAGGVALAGAPLLERLEGALARLAQESALLQQMVRPGRLCLSELRSDPGIYGAAALSLSALP